MANRPYNLDVVIRGIDRVTAPLRAIQSKIAAIASPIREVGAALGGLGRAAGVPQVAARVGNLGKSLMTATGAATMLGVKLGALGIGGAWLFNDQFIKTAATFEDFGAVLETIEGSAAKAKAALAWISDFAAKTPYDLEGVTDAFVKLKAYGLDPQKGLLETLGNTAAAMKKPLMQAVEAVADAITGENERLKEFGIKASKTGKQIVYEYTVNGKQMKSRAKADSREQIQAVLSAIWNTKFAGAMDRLSKTWNGLTSNLGDQWTRFKQMVMEAGPFEFLKTELAGLLATADRMAADGSLKELAKDLGGRIVEALKAIKAAVPEVLQGLRDLGDIIVRVKDFLGGWDKLLIALGVAMGAPLVTAIASVTTALVALGAALLTNPIGLILTAIGAAALVIYANWEPIKAFFSGFWDDAKVAWAAAERDLKAFFSLLEPPIRAFGEAFDEWVIQPIKQAIAWIERLIQKLPSIPNLSDLVPGAGRLFSGRKAQPSNDPADMEDASRGASWLRGNRALGAADARPGGAGAAGAAPKAEVTVDFQNVPRGVTITPKQNQDSVLRLNTGRTLIDAY